MILHAEQRIEVFQKLRHDTEYQITGGCSDVIDKKSMALVTVSTEITEKQQLVARAESTVAIKGLGGFGHRSKTGKQIPEKPKGAPDFTLADSSEPGQAFLYRLSS